MTADVLIGLPQAANLQALVDPLQRVFATEFEERESDHYGGTYYLAELADGSEIRVYENEDPTQWHAFPFLVRFFGSARSADELLAEIQEQVHAEAQLLPRP